MDKRLEIERAATEIYLLFRAHHNSISEVSHNLRNCDSSKLSRQLSTTDDRRDNPFVEVLEILLIGTMPFSPELARKVWKVVEREWSLHQPADQNIEEQLNELLGKIFDELRDVSTMKKGASKSDWQKESWELLAAAQDLYEKVKQWKEE